MSIWIHNTRSVNRKLLISGFPWHIYFLLSRVVPPDLEHLDKVDRLRSNRADGFRPAMEVYLRHGGLICILDAAIETVISRLEGKLEVTRIPSPQIPNTTLRRA